MNKLLRLLLICVCCCVAVTSAWAQTGREVIVGGQMARDIATGAGVVSHVPQAAAATGAITQQVTQAVDAAQQAARGTSALGGISTGIPSQQTGVTGVRNSAPSASSQAPHVPPPSTVAKAELPGASAPQSTPYRPATLAQQLIKPGLDEKLKQRIYLFSAYLNRARMKAGLTQEQLARLEEAEKYFFGLTVEQFNDMDTLYSVPFRQHAMVVHSPDATEYGYFFTGGEMTANYEQMFPIVHGGVINEEGYIPTFWGDPKNGILWNIKEITQSAAKTDQPIFVLMDMHGLIHHDGNFRAYASILSSLSTDMIVRDMQELRQATGSPELNLAVSSCHGGAFLDEFEALPLSQRQGINVFVPTGASQCAFLPDTTPYHNHQKGENIAKELTGKLIIQLMNGQLMAQANIAGQSFNPLELAIQKANALPDKDLLYQLTDLFNLQKTKQQNSGINPSRYYLDKEAWYFVARVAYDEAVARYGEIFDQYRRNVLKGMRTSSSRIPDLPQDLDIKFGFEPLE